jgi:hypothetical protein
VVGVYCLKGNRYNKLNQFVLSLSLSLSLSPRTHSLVIFLMFSYCLDKFVLTLEAAADLLFIIIIIFHLIFYKLDLKREGWGL